VLVNWYDGRLNHYIGRHRDSTANMIVGTPIVTISLGEERIFRLRRWREQVKGEEAVDFPATNGAAFVMPYETNLHWTHEVPRRARNRGRRISVTLRGFM
jgi:alkylated DNA repair dioxygenase AlkB